MKKLNLKKVGAVLAIGFSSVASVIVFQNCAPENGVSLPETNESTAASTDADESADDDSLFEASAEVDMNADPGSVAAESTVASGPRLSVVAGCQQPPATDLIVNVKDMGAKGNGRRNDTAAIQAAIDAAAASKGTVFVPKGVYMVETLTKKLMLKSNMNFNMAPGAVLKAIPNAAVKYYVLSISGVSNVTVTGGTLFGDRTKHKGTAGEWGIGLFIARGARNITVNGVNSNNMWGDGFYVSGARNVTLCKVSANNNRRQGLSVIEVNGLLVTNSVFKNTHGTKPGAGIDLEPNFDNQQIINVKILNSKFIHNEGGGIIVYREKGKISRLVMKGNTIVP